MRKQSFQKFNVLNFWQVLQSTSTRNLFYGNIELTRELLVDYFYGREVHVSSTKLKDICEKNSDIYMLAQSTDKLFSIICICSVKTVMTIQLDSFVYYSHVFAQSRSRRFSSLLEEYYYFRGQTFTCKLLKLLKQNFKAFFFFETA